MSLGKSKSHYFASYKPIIEYNNDRSGSERYSIVEGTYTTRERGHDQALRVLLDTDMAKGDFVEYDKPELMLLCMP
jgi:hypothetical protein